MSTEPKIYDELYASYAPYETTAMKHMYDKVAKMIPRTATVVDLGCGNGYLASALDAAGFVGSYTGYDFSAVAVTDAETALSPTQGTLWEVAPRYDFRKLDLDAWHAEVKEDTHRTVYTCLEVLEHYYLDVALINKLPARSRFIFSVPNFWSKTHLRVYSSVGSAFNRYSHALRFNAWWLLPTKQPDAAIYLYDTYRKADAW